MGTPVTGASGTPISTAGTPMPTVDRPDLSLRPSGKRFCVRCGLSFTKVAFRSSRAQKCISCDEEVEEERRLYHKRYHQARAKAIHQLIELHNDEFEAFLTIERVRIEQDEERERRQAAATESQAS